MEKTMRYTVTESSLDLSKKLISGVGIVRIVKQNYFHDRLSTILVEVDIKKSKFNDIIGDMDINYQKHHSIFSLYFFKILFKKASSIFNKKIDNDHITLQWRVHPTRHNPTNLEIIDYDSLKYSFVRFPPIDLFGVYNRPLLRIVK
jgi:hypothetical protein